VNTPRTEAKVSNIIGFWSCATVPAEFARELERELIDLTAAHKILIAQVQRWNDDVTQIIGRVPATGIDLESAKEALGRDVK
jgi:hypothetical protein